ncbi:MAG: DUF883 family protein [Xanthomonadales bacterium]|nr:DUF883 family protein [Xanthomonadales bacterium]
MNTTPLRSGTEGTEHLKQAAHAAADGFRKAAESLKEATSHATEELTEAGAAAARGAQDLWDQAGQAIRKHPMAAAGIAFAAGLVLSRLIRR